MVIRREGGWVVTKLVQGDITGKILGAYFEVYNHTPRYYPEYLAEKAMMVELRRQGYAATRQDQYEILYKGKLVGIQRLDIFVLEEVVVENKVAEKLTRLHKAQGQSYLKTVGKMVGLVLNFGSAKPEFERLYYNPAERQLPPQREPLQNKPQREDLLYPELTVKAIGGLYEVYSMLGPGFVHRIYQNACYHEMGLRGFSCKPLKRMQIRYKGEPIGDMAFGHIQLESKIMVFPVAIRDMNGIHRDSLKSWMHANNIRLGILANFNNLRLEMDFIRA